MISDSSQPGYGPGEALASMVGEMRRALVFLALLPCFILSIEARDPDLIVDQSQLADHWYIDEQYFPPGHCALVEQCVGGPGVRKLLRFRTTTANIGRVDLEMGDPTTNPLFILSPCHGHYHFEDYADYRLLDLMGTIVAPGHKQAFCLEDSFQYLFDPWVELTRKYDCDFQGMQAGWSDIYGAALDCQWVDITDVPNGTYVLEVEINPAQVITEADLTNNTASVQVEVTDIVGISHRPDGRIILGSQLRIGRGGDLDRVQYDVDTCPAQDYNALYSTSSVASYTYDGAVCSLGASGDASIALPEPLPGELLWFTIVGVDSSIVPQGEGGHGFDSDGSPRPLTGVGLCGVSETRPRTYCSG